MISPDIFMLSSLPVYQDILLVDSPSVEFYPAKHPYMTPAAQRRAARKRRNILKRKSKR